MKIRITVILFFFFCSSASAQKISGNIFSKDDEKPLHGVEIILKNTAYKTFTNADGYFELNNIPSAKYTLIIFMSGFQKIEKNISLTHSDLKLDFRMQVFQQSMEELNIKPLDEVTFGLAHLKQVEGTAIYAGKKNEVIVLKDITANTAANNPRQVFSQVAGLNVWESDGAGLQLGIGARGLNPNRTAEFNTRLNGYDLSADAIGYPETYYTPPVEALEKIQVVRGAASLQYGPQFGGTLNFVTKKGSAEKPIEVTSRQTVGSYGFFNTFNSVGGTYKNLNYYNYIHYRRGNGWRENSGFEMKSFYSNLNFDVSKRLRISSEFTTMNYITQQAGGLTDRMFEENPRQSIRERNWFMVGWNLGSIGINYNISEKTILNSKTYGLYASREALGFLGNITRTDPLEFRDLLSDRYMNTGNETRLIHRYSIKNNPANILVGVRMYNGNLSRKQGLGNKEYGADFSYINPDNLEGSDYTFPSRNLAVFAENIFTINSKLSVTPGVRVEYISTKSDGFYRQQYRDLVGTVTEDVRIYENNSRCRQFPLFGLGVGYDISEKIEAYGNISQNYRAITFNDFRVANPSLRVDSALQDEKGFNADLGIRGKWGKNMNFDATLFYLSYNNRIGLVQKTDPFLFTAYRFRTNVSDSRTYGLETYLDYDILKLFNPKCEDKSISIFSNATILDARYIKSEEAAFRNKKVELVPNMILKYGLTYRNKVFSVSYNFAYTSSHYTDATNAEFTSSAVNGVIPAYYVMDLSSRYKLKKHLSFEAGCNNLTNNMYFTRRADGYPGPGIIPSDGRNFYFGIQGVF